MNGVETNACVLRLALLENKVCVTHIADLLRSVVLSISPAHTHGRWTRSRYPTNFHKFLVRTDQRGRPTSASERLYRSRHVSSRSHYIVDSVIA